MFISVIDFLVNIALIEKVVDKIFKQIAQFIFIYLTTKHNYMLKFKTKSGMKNKKTYVIPTPL